MRTLAFVLASAAAVTAGADTIRFTPTGGVPTFAARAPVLRIKPGDVVETRTFSVAGDYYDRAGGRWPGEVGPFFIEGAAPGDTLVVRILTLSPNRDTAVSAVNPGGISAVAADGRTRLLNDPLPARRFEWRLDRTRGVGIMARPMTHLISFRDAATPCRPASLLAPEARPRLPSQHTPRHAGTPNPAKTWR